MAQVLKEEIRANILKVALDEFYSKDFKSATMRDIAKKANIPTGLIYSYYKNKQDLFNEVVRPVCFDWSKILQQYNPPKNDSLDRLSNMEKEFILKLFDYQREFIVLIDKSAGTDYQHEKAKMIKIIEEHIQNAWNNLNMEYDDIFIHILASNFMESLLEVMRHFKNKEWASKILNQLTQLFFPGIAL